MKSNFYPLFLASFIISGCTLIRPGETGIVFNKLTGGLSQGNQGYFLVLPFREVQEYPISLRTYTMVERGDEGSARGDDSMDLPSAEGQHIRQDISVTYNTNSEKAIEVYKNFRGADIELIEKTYIRRTIVTVAQNLAGKMSLTELISTKREELQAGIERGLTEEMGKMGFIVDKVNLGASHLPKSVEEQMQQKMAAQQDAQRADYELQKQQTLAKAKIVEAEGIAKANSILNNTLTPLLIERMKVEKWNGILPTVSGANGLMINLNPTTIK